MCRLDFLEAHVAAKESAPRVFVLLDVVVATLNRSGTRAAVFW